MVFPLESILYEFEFYVNQHVLIIEHEIFQASLLILLFPVNVLRVLRMLSTNAVGRKSTL